MTTLAEPKRREVSSEEFLKAYGDPNLPIDKLTPEQIDNRKIIKSVTSKYQSLISPEDLTTCGLIAMWRCLGYHRQVVGRTGKPQKFTTSLYRFTSWECRRELAKKKKKENVPLTLPISDFEKDNVTAPADHEDIHHIRECISLLPEHHRELIVEYYLDRRTMEEIGDRHNYSKEAARQKIAKAVRRLRELYHDKK